MPVFGSVQREPSRTTTLGLDTGGSGRDTSTGTQIGGVQTGTDSSSSLAAQAISAGTGLAPLPFYTTPAVSQTAAQLLRPGTAAAISVRSPFRGSILGLSFSADSNKTAGALTFTIYINGQATGATLAWPNGTATGFVGWPKGTYSFAAGDTLDIRYTSDGSYAPITAKVEACMFLLFTQTSAI